MIHLFEIKPSIQTISFIIFVHLFVAILIVNFVVPDYMKFFLVSAIVVSFYYQWCQWKLSKCQLKYAAKTKQWSVSAGSVECINYQELRTIYLNCTFVWIILSSPGLSSKYIWVGVDSMSAEKFLQFRQCILCPELSSYKLT